MDVLISIGVTGSREGPVTEEQARAAVSLLDYLYRERHAFYLHHGDCVGADAFMAEAERGRYWVISHPSVNDRFRAHAYADETREPKRYLERNRDIVDSSDIVIALPGWSQDRTGGTWYTIKYARSIRRELIILYPDGSALIDADIGWHPPGPMIEEGP